MTMKTNMTTGCRYEISIFRRGFQKLVDKTLHAGPNIADMAVLFGDLNAQEMHFRLQLGATRIDLLQQFVELAKIAKPGRSAIQAGFMA